MRLEAVAGAAMRLWKPALVLMLLSGCVPAPTGASGSSQTGTESAADAASDAVRPMLLTNIGIMQVPDLQAHLEDIAARLSAQLPVPQPAPQVYLVLDPDFVGDSGPNGGIFLSLGMVRALRSDDAMAFVIAHEMGHIWLGHLKARGSTQDWEHSLQVLAIGGIRIVAHNDANPTTLKDLSRPEMRDIAATQAAGSVTDTVVFSSWSRSQERAADQFGAALVIKAGYSPAGADAVFDQIEANDNVQRQHLADIESAADQAKERASGPATLNGLADSLLQAGFDRVEQQMSTIDSTLADKHGSAAERRDAVQAYVDATITRSPGRLKTREWAQVMADPDTQARLEAYAVLSQALDAFHAGALAQSVALERRVDDSPIAQDPMAVDLRAHLVTDGGDSLLARQMLIGLMPRPFVVVDSYIQLMQLDLQAGAIRQAYATMEFANGVLHSPQELYPVDLQVLRAAGDQFQLEGVLARCYLVGDDALSSACKLAAGV